MGMKSPERNESEIVAQDLIFTTGLERGFSDVHGITDTKYPRIMSRPKRGRSLK
jgi:hypothetical protein